MKMETDMRTYGLEDVHGWTPGMHIAHGHRHGHRHFGSQILASNNREEQMCCSVANFFE
jgi:hypothetical protein